MSLFNTIKLNGKEWTHDINWRLNDDKKCDSGRLYSFEAARTNCPQGWHLPTKEEWESILLWDLKEFEPKLNGLYCCGHYADSGKRAYYWTAEGDIMNFGDKWGVRSALPLSYCQVRYVKNVD